jgi:hypothetical protein
MSDLITLPRAVFRKWRNALMEVWVTANTGSRLEIEHILAALDAALAQQAEPVQAEPVVDRSEATLLAVWHEAMAREPKRNEAKREKHHRTAFELRRLHSENELLRTQQQAEPVVWECKAGGLKPLSQRLHDLQPDNIKRHYTPTPRRHEWQGLTEDDFPAIRDGDTAFRSGALWADRLLKEKNYG